MTLSKQIVDSLRRVADGAIQAEGGALTVAGARLEIADHDRYSVALRSLTLGGAARPAPQDLRAELSARAAALARGLSYLEEPLAVWELDGAEGAAQLRSSPPQREGEALWYWEVTLRAGERPSASLARYRWEPGMAEREPVIYPATFALVGRIAESLEGALAE